MFGDVVDGHWFLPGGCRIGDRFAGLSNGGYAR
jgi:hypothetical protein